MLFADFAAPSFQELAALTLVSLAAAHLVWRFVRASRQAWGNSSAAGCGGGCQGCGKAQQLVAITPFADSTREV